MRHITFLLIAFFIAGVQAAPSQEVFGPRVSVKELRYDLGKVQQGTQASHVFEVKNEGTETLIIQNVQPG